MVHRPLNKAFYLVKRAKGLDAPDEESFRAILRDRRDWSASVSFQLCNNVAMHLRAFAIDSALQLQTRAMVRRQLGGNHLTVIRGIVPPLGVFLDKRQQ